MLSAREASHMVREIGQRLDANSCSWGQCRKYTLCEGLGPADGGGVQTAPALSAQDSNQDGTQHVCGLKKYRTQNTWQAWRTAWSPWGMAWSPWETRGEAALTAGPPLGPHLDETSETGLLFLGPFSPPLLFHVCGVWAVIIKVLGSSQKKKKKILDWRKMF